MEGVFYMFIANKTMACIVIQEQIKDSIALKYFVFTDSLSCLQAGTSPDWDGDTKVCLFKYCQKRHCFCWVPSHTGIKGNEKADSAAKSALDLHRAKVGVPYTDFKHLISQYIFSTWQDDWNGAVMNKLHSSSQTWEIGSPPTGGAGRMKLSCVIPTSIIRIGPIHIS